MPRIRALGRQLRASAASASAAVVEFDGTEEASFSNDCIAAVLDAFKSDGDAVFALASKAPATERRQLAAAEPRAHFSPPSLPRKISTTAGRRPEPYFPTPLTIDDTCVRCRAHGWRGLTDPSQRGRRFVHMDPQTMAALLISLVLVWLLSCAVNHALDLQSQPLEPQLLRQKLLAERFSVGKDDY